MCAHACACLCGYVDSYWYHTPAEFNPAKKIGLENANSCDASLYTKGNLRPLAMQGKPVAQTGGKIGQTDDCAQIDSFHSNCKNGLCIFCQRLRIAKRGILDESNLKMDQLRKQQGKAKKNLAPCQCPHALQDVVHVHPDVLAAYEFVQPGPHHTRGPLGLCTSMDARGDAGGG